MGYFVVSSDMGTVIEFRDDHKILGLVDFGDIEPDSLIITRDDVVLVGDFDSGFDECIAITDAHRS